MAADCDSKNKFYDSVQGGLLNLLSANPTKWSNTLKQLIGNSRFDHLMGLALKGLILCTMLLGKV